MTAPETVSDPDLQEVAWDLSHLLNGAGDDPQAGVDALLADAQQPRRRVRRALRRQARRDRRRRPRRRRCASSPRSRRSRAAPAPTRTSRSRSTPPRPPTARCCSASRRRAPRSRPSSCSSTSSGRRWTTRGPRSCSPPTGSTSRATTCATARRYRPHLLSEPEERILTEKALSRPLRVGAAVRGADGGDHGRRSRTARSPLDVALSQLFDPDREVRRDAAERVTAALQPGLRTRAYTFNTLLADKMTDDRLRSYPHWLAARNLSNEASDESVQALIEAVRGALRAAAPLVPAEGAAARHRPARRLRPHGRGHPGHRAGRLARGQADRPATPTRRSRGELGALVDRFFDEPWIDGPVRPGKRGGAFCSYGVPSVHPYVMLNYTYLRRDVLTLAHELGHGVHAVLGSTQGVFHMATPLTLAETASVFGETLVFGRLLEASPSPESRLLAAGRVDRGLDRDGLPPGRDEPLRAPRPHGAPRRGRAVRGHASARCGRSRRRSCSATRSRSPRATAPGGPTSRTSSPRRATSTRTPTGSCSRSRSTAATRRRGRSFVVLLPRAARARAGRSRREELGAIVGVDLADPGFWDKGLDLVERKLDAAEAAAREAGRV